MGEARVAGRSLAAAPKIPSQLHGGLQPGWGQQSTRGATTPKPSLSGCNQIFCWGESGWKVNKGAGDVVPTGGIHGNSRLSTKAQHGYEIVDTTSGEVVKTGVSGGRRTATGGSARANSQANQWNREAGQPGRYEPRVVKEVPAGPGARQQILEWEAGNAAQLREAGQLRDPTKHVRP